MRLRIGALRVMVGTVGLGLTICMGLLSSARADPSPQPMPAPLPRAASVSVCTDQYLLSLAAPDQVAAVSWQANTARSPVRHLAGNYPVLRGAAEEMLAVRADLVIFDTYGHPQTAARMEELWMWKKKPCVSQMSWG